VNKDNVLFAAIGLLLGFIGGYLLHEVMVARQPARHLAGDLGAGSAPIAPGAQVGPEAAPPIDAVDAGAAPAAGAGGAPQMAAIQQLRDHVEAHPEDAAAVLELANLNYNISNWPRALDLYERYIALRPESPDVLTDLGTCYRNLGQFDRALALFKKAEALAPQNWQARFNEVVVLGIDLRRFDDAKARLAELRRLQPNNADVSQLAAEIDRRRGAS
jgi:tetratricopeptide (TPR) repeat protein